MLARLEAPAHRQRPISSASLALVERPRHAAQLHRGDALHAYDSWPSPNMILSDGAYGVGGFPGDPRTHDGLVYWYRPHVEAWSRRVNAATTLWFWNTEIGWATVHPLLAQHGWEYVQVLVWDKGIRHIAGNVNGDTIRQFPVVTEICVLYRRRLTFDTASGTLSARDGCATSGGARAHIERGQRRLRRKERGHT